MHVRVHRASAFTVAVLAVVPWIDGSFLVQGMIPTHRIKPPTIATPAPSPQPPNIATAGRVPQPIPQFRCPMLTAEPDPKVDPAFARRPPATPRFAITAKKSPCTSR